MALRPTTDVYNALLEGLYWDGRINTAKRIFNEMQRSAEKFLNERAFASHFPDAGRLENARKLFNHIPRKRLVPNVVTYNTMIRGLFSNKMFLEAAKLIIKTEEEGCLPNSKTYDTIINGFLGGKETGKALQFLRKMYGRHFASSDSTVINGGSGGKETGNALQNLRNMLKNLEETRKIFSPSDSIIYSLVKTLCR
ncbi:pentatricopeptide repeat-containing protein At1g62930, chloroplastic-like [Papaver somniferum]|uniref:pentatricopeptide repeat-containing protein At1g62930, chloroplastic-like n=1 Tax=Papaver somniferum TaxID=3469 RepID=UPI000E6F9B8B|nr:pentatricopeptide repeat-containing protein At1g62930, chloroplastic-like [Papaver somniferum]